jgi:alpha-aminoadipate carrier protein LysW
MAIATCVECDEEIELSGRLQLGQMVLCDSCGARLEIVSVNPLEVDWAYEDDEDDDDWDDEPLGDEATGESDLDDEFDDDLADDWDDLEEEAEEEWR